MEFIKGFVQLKNARPGELVRFEEGDYAIVSEYESEEWNHKDAYISGSGEALHTDGNQWVAVIDMEAISGTLELDTLTYPQATS